mmetsp:Transcript_82082/g.232440  ORF Transcript_82082/g.232440 Transcript_82082/m.232440 type:complete len:307 (-) Transcript_82082:2339-3259(-)
MPEQGGRAPPLRAVGVCDLSGLQPHGRGGGHTLDRGQPLGCVRGPNRVGLLPACRRRAMQTCLVQRRPRVCARCRRGRTGTCRVHLAVAVGPRGARAPSEHTVQSTSRGPQTEASLRAEASIGDPGRRGEGGRSPGSGDGGCLARRCARSVVAGAAAARGRGKRWAGSSPPPQLASAQREAGREAEGGGITTEPTPSWTGCFHRGEGTPSCTLRPSGRHVGRSQHCFPACQGRHETKGCWGQVPPGPCSDVCLPACGCGPPLCEDGRRSASVLLRLGFHLGAVVFHAVWLCPVHCAPASAQGGGCV